MELRVAGVMKESIVDGPGLRYVVFAQGCRRRCAGCQNPQTHDVDGGYLLDTGEICLDMARNPLLDGLTLSGGEPFLQPQPLAQLAADVKAVGMDVVVFTGYMYEELRKLSRGNRYVRLLLENIELLIDGPFQLDKKSIGLLFRGSANQRLIDVPASLRSGKVVLWQSQR